MRALILMALEHLPSCENEMLFPVEHEGERFVWGVWKDAAGWTVNEFYENDPGWICNTGKETREAALDFVKDWMAEYTPEYKALYFKPPSVH